MEVNGEILRGAKGKSLSTSSATQPKKPRERKMCKHCVTFQSNYPTLQKTAKQNSPAKFMTGGKT